MTDSIYSMSSLRLRRETKSEHTTRKSMMPPSTAARMYCSKSRLAAAKATMKKRYSLMFGSTSLCIFLFTAASTSLFSSRRAAAWPGQSPAWF